MLLRQDIELGPKSEVVLGAQQLGCETVTDALFLVAAVDGLWEQTRHAGVEGEHPLTAAEDQLRHLVTGQTFPQDGRFLTAEVSTAITDFAKKSVAQSNVLNFDGSLRDTRTLAVLGGARLLDREIRTLHHALPGALHFVLPEVFPEPYADPVIGNDESGIFPSPKTDFEALQARGGLVVGDAHVRTQIPANIVLASGSMQGLATRPRLQ